MNITNKVLNSKTVTLEPREVVRVDAAIALGLLEIVMVDDPDYDFENLCGDTYNPDVNPDINPEQLNKEKHEFKRRVNREGVFGVVLKCRSLPSSEWTEIETIWGFVGEDFIGSGYDNDFINTAHDWLHAEIDATTMYRLITDLM